jgi:PAS domain S-box-containing protein
MLKISVFEYLKDRGFVKRLIAMLLLCAVVFGVTGCVSEPAVPADGADMGSIESYRDIPGVTEEEIAGIEALKASRQSFSFGKIHSTEWFMQPDGTYAGFSVMLCELLSDLFGIPFVIELHDWNSNIAGIDSREIDFTSELGITPERRGRYHMSEPIAQRSLGILTYGGRVIETPQELNGLRVGMIWESSAVARTVSSAYPELEFETVLIPNTAVEADMLRNGEIDAVIGISARMNYDYEGMTDFTLVNGLLPLAYTSVAMTTAIDELEPIISVINRYIAAGGINRLYDLYRGGSEKYNRNILYNTFSDAERAYIDNLTASVPVVLGADTYPVSFYNPNEGEFQGISIDVLAEISKLTGIEFEPVSEKDASWGDIIEKLRTGEAALISDLIITEERKEYFIWPETPFFSTPYAFISKIEYPNIELYDVGQAAVGVVEWCATRQIYDQWFPNHSDIKLYEYQDDAFDALENDEIDLFFNLGYILYHQQNYREKLGYKANFTFPVFNDIFFGLNKKETALCSIIDKTLVYIDTGRISNEWTSRSFDYSKMLAEEHSRNANQRTLIVVVFAAVLFLLMATLISLLLLNNKTKNIAMKAEKEASAEQKRMICELEEAQAAASAIMAEIRSREKELINSQEINELQLTKLNAVVKATKIGQYEVNIVNNDFLHPNNTVIFTDEFRNMLGYSSEADFPNSLGNWKKHLHPDDVEKTLKAVVSHVSDKSGQTPYDEEYRLLRKDGEYAYFRACGEAIRDKHGNALRIAGALMDITETKKNLMEHELHLTKLNLMLKATQIALWDMFVRKDDPVNPGNEIIYSDEFRHMLGYSDENDFPNLISSWSDKLHPEDKERSLNAFAAHMLDKTGETPFDIEYRLLKKDGGYSYYHAFGETIRDSDGDPIHVAGSLMDVTEEKNNILNIERLRQEAEEANEAKSTFLANMSHEIRTPLNAVIGLSELVLQSNEWNKENYYRLERINNAGATLLSTVNDILDISKIESGKFELVPTTYDTPGMLNDAVTQSILHRGGKPIEFLMNVSNTLPKQLYGDDLRLKQILNNFLSNAFKYTAEGTVELNVDYVREGEAVWLTFVIRDTGIGIKKEDMSNLFRDYVQVDMSANRKIVGTGLGLSIAKRLIELMHGEVKTESEYGKGSVFTVRLMQKYAGDEVIGPKVIESLKQLNYSEHKRRRFGDLARISLPYARVLIVDDVITNLDVAKGLMKPYGMKIDCVTGGREAIDAMMDSSVRYNAVFMDHMMPGMDGIEAARRIREIGTDYAKSIPIIALTANAIVGNEEMFLSNGFQAFLSKPIDITHIDAVIREWVRDKEQEKPHSLSEGPPVQNIGKDWKALDKGISGLDVNKGISRMGGDKDAYLGVLRSYARNTPSLLEASADASRGDLTEYATIVHGIKGSSAGICAEETAGLAEALENAAYAGDINYINANNAALSVTARKLISDINAMLDEINADNPKPKRDRPDSGTLDRLRRACTDFEMSVVDAALEELEAYSYESGGELISWLRENAEQMNFDEIAKRISDY